MSVNLYVYFQSEERYSSIQRKSLTILEFYTEIKNKNTKNNNSISTYDIYGNMVIPRNE